jgi:transmembrane sensor
MTKVDDAQTEVEARAQAWVVRLRSGDATTEDAQAFLNWCAEHPAHERAVRAWGKTWNTLGAAAAEFEAQESASGRSLASGVARLQAQRTGRRAFMGVAVAAGASWLALRPPLQLWPAIGDFLADYRTGTGEQRQVALSDRVVVEMNTQTRLNVLPVQATQQHGIDLLDGEAEIVAGPAATAAGLVRPVVVVAGPGRLQAQTARFDVRRSGDRICVTCLSGSVAFEHPQQQSTLLAGDQLIYGRHAVLPVSRVDANGVTAWRRGELVFKGAPLAQVIDEINRYRPGKVILRNAKLGQRHVQAKFSIARLDDALDMICELYGAHVTTLPGNIALLS